MRKSLIMAFAFSAGVLLAAETLMSLAQARAKIGEAVVNPAIMTSTVKQLSPDNQKLFLADCNEAVGKMPGSIESKAATYLAVNRAALKGAAKGNLTDLLAEVFATVPPEALTVINERFAADLFNRAANPSVVYTDDQFVNIAENVMSSVTNRTAKTDGATVRNAFAVMMLVRASNGTPADLASTLSKFLAEDSRKVAVEEWISAATRENGSYDPILGAADAGEQPNMSLVLQLDGTQTLDAMLGDLYAGIAGPDRLNAASFQNVSDVVTTVKIATPAIGVDAGLDRRPIGYDEYKEPDGYQWQTIGGRWRR